MSRVSLKTVVREDPERDLTELLVDLARRVPGMSDSALDEAVDDLVEATLEASRDQLAKLEIAGAFLYSLRPAHFGARAKYLRRLIVEHHRLAQYVCLVDSRAVLDHTTPEERAILDEGAHVGALRRLRDGGFDVLPRLRGLMRALLKEYGR